MCHVFSACPRNAVTVSWDHHQKPRFYEDTCYRVPGVGMGKLLTWKTETLACLDRALPTHVWLVVSGQRMIFLRSKPSFVSIKLVKIEVGIYQCLLDVNAGFGCWRECSVFIAALKRSVPQPSHLILAAARGCGEFSGDAFSMCSYNNDHCFGRPSKWHHRC
jgi:hypothetical protein